MQADERVDRLPVRLVAVDAVEVLDATVTERRVHRLVMNDLQTIHTKRVGRELPSTTTI